MAIFRLFVHFRSLVLVCTVFKQACKGHFDNCHYMMFSNKISLLIELLVLQLTVSSFRSLVLVCTVFKQACKGHFDNCHYMMFSNKISLLIELLVLQLTVSSLTIRRDIFEEWGLESIGLEIL